jgi:hypothetical protein
MAIADIRPSVTGIITVTLARQKPVSWRIGIKMTLLLLLTTLTANAQTQMPAHPGTDAEKIRDAMRAGPTVHIVCCEREPITGPAFPATRFYVTSQPALIRFSWSGSKTALPVASLTSKRSGFRTCTTAHGSRTSRARMTRRRVGTSMSALTS